MEFERDFDAVQLSFMNLLKVENVALRLGKANANVERVDLEKNLKKQNTLVKIHTCVDQIK